MAQNYGSQWDESKECEAVILSEINDILVFFSSDLIINKYAESDSVSLVISKSHCPLSDNKTRAYALKFDHFIT